ncbi:MAG: hypothetical protein ACRBEE_07925 [Arenicella sp.]
MQIGNIQGENVTIAEYVNNIFLAVSKGKVTQEIKDDLKQALLAGGGDKSLKFDNTIIKIENLNNLNFDSSNEIDIDIDKIKDIVSQLQNEIHEEKFDSSLQAYCKSILHYESLFPYRSTVDAGDKLNEVIIPLFAKQSQDSPNLKLINSGSLLSIINDFLNTETIAPLVLTGDSGIGKTTSLRYISSHIWSNPSVLGISEKYLPMIIKLPSFLNVDENILERRLWKALAHSGDILIEGKEPPEGFFQEWAKRANCKWLLMFDGLDELSERQRETALDLISQIMKSNGSFNLIVTSRPIDELSNYQCIKYSIEELQVSQIRSLSKKWLNNDFNIFFNHVKKGTLLEILRRPLFLTVALKNFKLNKTFSGTRAELIQDSLKSITKEAMARGMKSDMGTNLYPYAENVLETIAIATYEDPDDRTLNTITRRVEEYLLHQITESELVNAQNAETLISTLGTRSGVFRIKNGTWDWEHLVYRDFLVARGLVKSIKSRVEVVNEIFEQRTNMGNWQMLFMFYTILINAQKYGIRHDFDITSMFSLHIKSLLSKNKIGRNSSNHESGETLNQKDLIFAAMLLAEGVVLDKELSDEILLAIFKNGKNIIGKANHCSKALTPGPYFDEYDAVCAVSHIPKAEEYLLELVDFAIKSIIEGDDNYRSYILFLRDTHNIDRIIEITKNYRCPTLVQIEALDQLTYFENHKDESISKLLQLLKNRGSKIEKKNLNSEEIEMFAKAIHSYENFLKLSDSELLKITNSKQDSYLYRRFSQFRYFFRNSNEIPAMEESLLEDFKWLIQDIDLQKLSDLVNVNEISASFFHIYDDQRLVNGIQDALTPIWLKVLASEYLSAISNGEEGVYYLQNAMHKNNPNRNKFLNYKAVNSILEILKYKNCDNELLAIANNSKLTIETRVLSLGHINEKSSLNLAPLTNKLLFAAIDEKDDIPEVVFDVYTKVVEPESIEKLIFSKHLTQEEKISCCVLACFNKRSFSKTIISTEKFDISLKVLIFTRIISTLDQSDDPSRAVISVARKKDYQSMLMDLLDKGLSENPENFNWLILRAKLFYEQENWKKSIKDFLLAYGLNEGSSEVVIKLSRAYYLDGDANTAIKWLDKAIAFDHKNDYAFYLRGLCNYDLNLFAEAIIDLTKCIDLGDGERAYKYRGLSKFYLKEYKDAMADLEHYITIDDEDSETELHLAWCYLTVDAHSQALIYFNKVLDEEPANDSALSGRGQTYLRNFQIDLAIKDFKHVIELEAADINEYEGLILSYLLAGKVKKAYEQIGKMMALDTLDDWSFYLTSIYKKKVGEDDEFIKNINKAIELLLNKFRNNHEKSQDDQFNLLLYKIVKNDETWKELFEDYYKKNKFSQSHLYGLVIDLRQLNLIFQKSEHILNAIEIVNNTSQQNQIDLTKEPPIPTRKRFTKGNRKLPDILVCSLETINGMESEKKYADLLLEKYSSEEKKTVCFLTLEDENYFYVQANFKWDHMDDDLPCDFKICIKFDLAKRDNLINILMEKGVDEYLFDDETFLNRVKSLNSSKSFLNSAKVVK